VTTRKFYRQLVTIEVLSEEEHQWSELDTVMYAITEGDCSGEVSFGAWENLDGKQMATKLQEQGRDSEFFNLTPDGEDYED
jgi:hypothetical protein